MDWQSIEAALDRAVFGAFAEPVRHGPLKNGTADPDRPVAEIMAVLHHPEVNNASALGKGMNTKVSTSSHQLVVNRSAYPAVELRLGDHIRAISRPGMPWYAISQVSARHSGIIICELGLGPRSI